MGAGARGEPQPRERKIDLSEIFAVILGGTSVSLGKVKPIPWRVMMSFNKGLR